MKNFKKGFTLVEMLIVVVIIGILAAAILPRLQGAQGATRDVAREKGLNDISSAIEMYAVAVGGYPADATASKKFSAKEALENPLVKSRQYLKDFPMDPAKQTRLPGFGAPSTTNVLGDHSYLYMLIKKNGNPNGAYMLVAKVETVDKANATSKMIESYNSNQEATTTNLCKVVSIGASDSTGPDTNGNCTVTKTENLRYVMIR